MPNFPFVILCFISVSIAQEPKECGQSLKTDPGVYSHVATDGNRDGKIIDWPWMVKIELFKDGKYVHHCGGSVVNRNHVLTAAHCLENVNQTNLRLLLGTDDILDTDGQVFQKLRKVEKYYIHPNYASRKIVYYDIAIIVLDEELEFDVGIQPICLPENAVENVDNRQYYAATLTGWGTPDRYDSTATSTNLKFTNLRIFPQQYCNRTYDVTGRRGTRIRLSMPQLFQDSIFCAGFEVGGEGSCYGDSGGPLVVYDAVNSFYTQVGVVRGTSGECGDGKFPDIYGRLENLDILTWIKTRAFGNKLAKTSFTSRTEKQPCLTTSKSPTSNQPCIFPWRYDGELRDGCITDQDPDGLFWCSTKVDSNLTHVSGRGYWGWCQPQCLTLISTSEGECQALNQEHWSWTCNNLYFSDSTCKGFCKHDQTMLITKQCSSSDSWNFLIGNQETEKSCSTLATKCLDGLQTINSGQFCFVGENKTFDDSIKACSQIKGYKLFEPRDLSTNDQVYEKGQELFKSERYWAWLGIHDRYSENNFVYASTNEPITFENWRPAQPDNGGGEENCTNFKDWYDSPEQKSQWNDERCTFAFYQICEKMPQCPDLDDDNWSWTCSDSYFSGSVCHGVCRHDLDLAIAKQCANADEWNLVAGDEETINSCLKLSQKCLGGLQTIDQGQFCFVGENKTFDDSIKACSQIKGYKLFEPRDLSTNDQVYEKGQELFRSERYWAWIGIHDKNQESKFVYASNNESITFENWRPEQPDNNGGEEHCANFKDWYASSKLRNQWNDERCFFEFYQICEKMK